MDWRKLSKLKNPSLRERHIQWDYGRPWRFLRRKECGKSIKTGNNFPHSYRRHYMCCALIASVGLLVDSDVLSWFIPMSPQSARPLDAVVEEFITYKTLKNRRPEYLKTLRSYLGRFRRCVPNDLAELRLEHVERWFLSSRHSAASQCAGIGRLSSFFSFCQRRCYIKDNPIKNIERPIVERKAPIILSPVEAAALLAITNSQRPDLLGYIALGLFTGIRPHEIYRMNWDQVDLRPRSLRDLEGYGMADVSSAASKVRLRRMVPIHPAGIAWLSKCERSGPIIPWTRTHPMTSKLARESGFKWSSDVLRHTCASYMIALYEDPGRVAHWLGNSPQILMTHYYQIVSAEDCAAFWSIKP